MATRGSYRWAAGLDDLIRALKVVASVPPESYELQDSRGNVIRRAVVGHRLAVPHGNYTIVYDAFGNQRRQPIAVTRGTTTLVSLPLAVE